MVEGHWGLGMDDERSWLLGGRAFGKAQSAPGATMQTKCPSGGHGQKGCGGASPYTRQHRFIVSARGALCPLSNHAKRTSEADQSQSHDDCVARAGPWKLEAKSVAVLTGHGRAGKLEK